MSLYTEYHDLMQSHSRESQSGSVETSNSAGLQSRCGSAVSTLSLFPQMSFSHALALFLSSHSLCCFLIALHASVPSLMHWLVWGGRSAAGWDDSRACFSLWVYYLCSGPLKTTQSGSGAQCGESVLTHRLLFLTPSRLRCLWRLWARGGRVTPACSVSA